MWTSLEAILPLFREEDEEGRYCFVRPECDELQGRPADLWLAGLLIVAGDRSEVKASPPL